MSSGFFLPARSGRRFCVYHPGAQDGPAIVYAHPFCEEMNKSRRMAALQARRFAAAGCSVLQIDLFGCGDSSGDFIDARWETWKEDLRLAIAWLRSRARGALGLWGLRLGATLAADVARDPALGVDQLVLWQPVASGELLITQFLRLRLAAEMLADGAAHSGVRGLREALRAGVAQEIGGYDLHPQLAAEIDALRLAELAPASGRVHCLEVASAEPKLTPASQRAMDAWRAKGLSVRAAAVEGEPFWSTLEITECKALLDATSASVLGVQ